MEPWIVIGLVIVGGVLVFVAQHFGWIDLSNKSKTSGSHSSAVGMLDEVFHPSRYEAQVELDRQTVLPAPAPVPGDGDHGIYEGQVRITLGKPRANAASAPDTPDAAAPNPTETDN